MNLTLDEIIKKIPEITRKKANAEGAIDKILEDLKDKFDINNMEEAEIKKEQLIKDIREYNKKIDKSIEEINGMVNWDEI